MPEDTNPAPAAEPTNTPPVEPAGTPSNEPVDDKNLYEIFYKELGVDGDFFKKHKDDLDGGDKEPPPEGDDTTKKEDEPADEPADDNDADADTDDEPTLDDLKKKTELSLEFEEDTPLSDEIQAELSELVDDIEVDDETLEKTVDMLERSTMEGYALAREEEQEKIEERNSQLKKDPIFSNANRNETFKNMDTAVRKFGGKDAKKLEAYLGSPGVMDVTLARFLNKIGQALNDQPEFTGKTVDMKTKGDDSGKKSELEMAKKQYAVFF